MPSDFTNISEINGVFTETELDTGVDFTETNNGTTIIIPGSGWGDEPWGDEPWGGDDQIIITGIAATIWTNIDTP